MTLWLFEKAAFAIIILPSKRIATLVAVATLVMICMVLSLRTDSYDSIRAWRSNHGGYGGERLAIALLMTSTVDQSEDLENDNYFVATRMVVWQLLHNPSTRINSSIDVFVMVTPDVSESRRERLKQDGVTLRPVEFLHTSNDGWLVPEEPRLADMMAKLRLWELTEYSRILFIDSDFVLREPLDGIFDDPATQRVSTLRGNFDRFDSEEPLPETYLLASLPETSDSNHDFPPSNINTPENMNGGFFMMAPDLVMFEHMKSIMDIEDAFDRKYMEQSLINYVHRKDGPMPWKETNFIWNIRYANENDFKEGIVSMHEKWWEQPAIYDNEEVKYYLRRVRWEMKGWYDGRESDKSLTRENSA